MTAPSLSLRYFLRISFSVVERRDNSSSLIKGFSIYFQFVPLKPVCWLEHTHTSVTRQLRKKTPDAPGTKSQSKMAIFYPPKVLENEVSLPHLQCVSKFSKFCCISPTVDFFGVKTCNFRHG